MMRMVVRTLSCCTWLLIMAAMLTSAQPADSDSRPPVLDTAGNPLEAGTEYFILPSPSGSDGPLTLVDNGTCPLFVGLDSTPPELPVVFKPFFEGEKLIRESSDFRVEFIALTLCLQSTQWKVVNSESTGSRRLIGTGAGEETGSFFRIEKKEGGGPHGYNLAWCPTDVCPFCRFDCGRAGVFTANNKKFLALDDVPVLSVVFRRA